MKPIVRHRVETARLQAKTAGHHAETVDAVSTEARAAEEVAECLTISLDLATDCLRLSMHFFHPIQQSAQQVYHTALPLSPTSSQLRKSCFWSAADKQLSCVDAFSGAPEKWGLLLRTINIRPRQLTCIATSAQRIAAACEDIVHVYDAVTFVLRQSLQAPEKVTNIHGTPDGSSLFFVHSCSVTMWDVQTGGLTHTFATRSEITNIAVSTTEDHIACSSSDGSVAFWDIHSKEGGGFGNGQPVIAICWLLSLELAVATQNAVYIRDITTGETSVSFSISDHVWGMVYSPLGGELLVGASQPGEGTDPDLCYFEIIKNIHLRKGAALELQPRMHYGRLLHPTFVDDRTVCISPPSGVLVFNTLFGHQPYRPPLLAAATSVAVSLNRNLVAQTQDSIQLFSLDVLTGVEARNKARPPRIYPLDEKHIVCLFQPTRYLTILKLETLEKLSLDENVPSLGLLPTNRSPSVRASFSQGLVAEFGVTVVLEAWRSGTPLPEWPEAVDEDPPLSGLSPDCTRVVTFYGSPRRELRAKDAKDGTILANLPLGNDDFGTGKVYDVTFDSATRFHLKIDGPGHHVRVPHDIIPSPVGPYSHAITKGEPIPLSEPRAKPSYTLDANCEWVVDAECRKICWISPGNVRRGNGGHFWAGLSLVMVGDDGVVRKLSFREPDS